MFGFPFHLMCFFIIIIIFNSVVQMKMLWMWPKRRQIIQTRPQWHLLNLMASVSLRNPLPICCMSTCKGCLSLRSCLHTWIFLVNSLDLASLTLKLSEPAYQTFSSKKKVPFMRLKRTCHHCSFFLYIHVKLKRKKIHRHATLNLYSLVCLIY